jgi:hypothetical protein
MFTNSDLEAKQSLLDSRLTNLFFNDRLQQGCQMVYLHSKNFGGPWNGIFLYIMAIWNIL